MNKVEYFTDLAKSIEKDERRMNDDTISRKAAIEILWEEPSYSDPLNVLTEARDRIKSLPSAQPEIIRCIDCIHYTPLGKDKSWGRCSVHSSPTENQRMCQSCDFCAWAERRQDG